MKYEIKRAVIKGISGQVMSGLWQLQLDSETVHIESGYGVRNLASAFGASEGTGDLQEKIEGQEIFYTVDEFGVLEGFTPVEEATPELMEMFKGQDESKKLQGNLKNNR